jgi:acetyl-CoA acetyltransferase
MELKSAVIVDAARSPFGRGGKGLLSHRDILDVAVEVVKAQMARNSKVDPWLVEDMGVGNAAGLFTVGAKIIAREAGLPHEVGGYEVDRQCGSSMEVCHHLARELHLSKARYGLATMCIGNGQGIATILEGILRKVFSKD